MHISFQRCLGLQCYPQAPFNLIRASQQLMSQTAEKLGSENTDLQKERPCILTVKREHCITFSSDSPHNTLDCLIGLSGIAIFQWGGGGGGGGGGNNFSA